MNEWENEPDVWQGEMVKAVRQSPSGHWCGYVGVPEGHPLFTMPYHDSEFPALEVHGGVSFTGFSPGDETLWWIGFDCAHAWDVLPHVVVNRPLCSYAAGAEYRTLPYVQNELRKLMRQLVACRKEKR